MAKRASTLALTRTTLIPDEDESKDVVTKVKVIVMEVEYFQMENRLN